MHLCVCVCVCDCTNVTKSEQRENGDEEWMNKNKKKIDRSFDVNASNGQLKRNKVRNQKCDRWTQHTRPSRCSQATITHCWQGQHLGEDTWKGKDKEEKADKKERKCQKGVEMWKTRQERSQRKRKSWQERHKDRVECKERGGNDQSSQQKRTKIKAKRWKATAAFKNRLPAKG